MPFVGLSERCIARFVERFDALIIVAHAEFSRRNRSPIPFGVSGEVGLNFEEPRFDRSLTDEHGGVFVGLFRRTIGKFEGERCVAMPHGDGWGFGDDSTEREPLVVMCAAI